MMFLKNFDCQTFSCGGQVVHWLKYCLGFLEKVFHGNMCILHNIKNTGRCILNMIKHEFECFELLQTRQQFANNGCRLKSSLYTKNYSNEDDLFRHKATYVTQHIIIVNMYDFLNGL